MSSERIRAVRLACSTVAVFAFVGVSFAESLICENPRREYNLVYDQGEAEVLINPDSAKVAWPVTSSLMDDRQHVVMVELGREGMTAQIHIRPFQKVDIFSRGELIQTDACYSAADAATNVQPRPLLSVARFSSFEVETAVVQDLTKCPKPKLSRDVGMPDLWGCVFPGAEVLKLFVNEDGKGGVKNVKIMWNDWTRDNGYGIHADRKIAMSWISALATRYAPHSVEAVVRAFKGTRDVTIDGDGYQLVFSYSKGPAIDERLLSITSE
ncbi:hypothetical protein [Sinisalibacter lacisalsi]|uniref:Uncharacterized protein n=1 Tax=Sinisalibacter lacisalsi TaxID=1526570 RepID=A0ABQ1QYQ7_9RHOB|nr:hypothetical protein [Sinisalibacter lacisalsi]GGD48000.1 hypothetical protein GCM10011358_34780 [Sinisalibacter lacisalsi]